MGFLRTVFILLAFWLLIRWVRGKLLPGSGRRPSSGSADPESAEDFANLTDQEISDADFEEIKEDPKV